MAEKSQNPLEMKQNYDINTALAERILSLFKEKGLFAPPRPLRKPSIHGANITKRQTP